MALPQTLEFFFAKRERLMSVAFFAGFIIDNFALTRIDVLWSSLVLLAYLLVAAVAVCLSASLRGDTAYPAAPFFAQFAFGSLFSSYFVFYTRSASLASSWLFVVLLGGLFLGNEFFKNYYQRLEFQVNILFIAIFFFATLYLPIVLGRMDAEVFLMSGGASLAAIALFILVLSRMVPEMIKTTRPTLAGSLGSVFVFLNVLYFTNIIPPIPLSLKEAGVYHTVVQMENGGYRAEGETVAWYDLRERYHPTIHRTPGEPLYFYSAVFAPTRLSVPIIHEWQYFDRVKNEWVTTDRLRFQITGGRDGGYRGYSVKSSLSAGEWRVNVLTERGQSLGRTNFTVVDASTATSLETNSLGGS